MPMPTAAAVWSARRPRSRRRRSVAAAAVAVVAAVLATGLPVACAQGATITQYHVKAAFLYNFAKFVDWPSDAFRDAEAPFNLCIVGTEPFISARETLVGKTLKGRKVEVRRIDGVAVGKACHMLFVTDAEGDGAGFDFAGIKGEVLTVGEVDGLVRKGSILTLKTVDNKIRFELDRDSGERLGFRFRSQVLQRAMAAGRGD